MFQVIADNIRMLGGCVAGIVGVCGGYVALDGPIPASRRYVLAQYEATKNRVIDSQIQLNTLQRDMRRKEKFDREMELRTDVPPLTRSIIQQRLDTISDDLDNLDRERDELRKEKAQK